MNRPPPFEQQRHVKALSASVRGILLTVILGGVAAWAGNAFAQTTNAPRLVELRGEAYVLTPDAHDWVPTRVNVSLGAHWRVRTGTNSSIGILWSDSTDVLRFNELTELEILPPDQRDKDNGLHLLDGILSFFHRAKPGRIRVITGGAFAGVYGTEFVMKVTHSNGVEHTTLSLIDGRVEFGNDTATLIMTSGEQAVAEPGRAPMITAGFNATNILQWCFYYPAVLDLKDLALTAEEEEVLSNSLAAYRSGDLLAALAQFPRGRMPASESEQIYYAALLLSVGQIEQAEVQLAAMTATGASEKNQQLANALRTLIAAVKRDQLPATLNWQPSTSTALLAASYYEQSRAVRETSLTTALQLARQAVTNSPGFGFGWERVAELEFSFGRTTRSLEALNKALAFSPRNAQALALEGFLLAAQNKTREAIGWFDRALAVDSALGNAWLGRGLCRIRRGDARAGREDLLIAAAMEPQRASLRSYLGKAWSDSGDDGHATKEFQLAKNLDQNDPTAWLYSALNDEQHNRINKAIRDLEKSQDLNENRSVYRSGLLLDQDRAVRSANLARIYQEAGMDELSLREAGKAVSADYANYSAHLFLANSYDALRDPNNINLRYETPAESEYLIANLLAPAGAGALSPAISQQEYSKLFERDHFGISSSTEYLDRGAWTQSGTQYGISGNSSYAFEADYRTDPGQRLNNDFEGKQFSLQIKHQLSPQDGVYVQVSRSDFSGGDLYQYYNPTNQLDAGLRVKEVQEPFLAVGYHREWQPGVHTLLLGSYLKDTYQVHDSHWQGIQADFQGITALDAQSFTAVQTYENTINFGSLEAQQIWERPQRTTVFGALLQVARYETDNRLELPFPNASIFNNPPADQHVDTDFHRISLYAYHTWQIADPLQIVVGLAYDNLLYPENFRAAPLADGTRTINEFSPKAGVIWKVTPSTTLRAAWARSVSGASLDQSLRLEPTEVAGFNQSFRSLIPESVGGSTAGARFETFGISLEQKFNTGTYLGLSGMLLRSKVDQTIGLYGLTNIASTAEIAQMPQQVNYCEHALLFTADQLVGPWMSLGLRYRLSDARLREDLTSFSESTKTFHDFPVTPRYNSSATLNQLTLQALLNHRSGFYAGLYGVWYSQSSSGTVAPPGDSFWQMNLLTGYRSPRRHFELQVGILNATDHDYRLNPLNLYNELPRKRTFAARLQINF